MRRVIDAQALKKCRDYLATTSTFFRREPTLSGKGRAEKSTYPPSAAGVWAALSERSYGGEEVPRMALRVQRPTSPHLED